MAIDLDAEGRVVGIEFVTASRVLHPSALEAAELDELMGVTEISEYLGKRKQNVAQHYTRRDDFPDQQLSSLPAGTGGAGTSRPGLHGSDALSTAGRRPRNHLGSRVTDAELLQRGGLVREPDRLVEKNGEIELFLRLGAERVAAALAES